METYPLRCHPDTPPLCVTRIEARLVDSDPEWLRVRWRIDGGARLVLPPFAGKGRVDELWRTTCFELFIQPAGNPGYTEINLSPSERWAAYDFSGYRDGMRERAMPREPVCTARAGRTLVIFDAAIPRTALPAAPWKYGLSAVIEETGGTISFWALAHPPGRPDFHHPACLDATLAAPEPS